MVLDDLDIESLMGENVNVIWFRENEIERLVAIENKKKIKIFPRYYWKNELIEKIRTILLEKFSYVNISQIQFLNKIMHLKKWHKLPSIMVVRWKNYAKKTNRLLVLILLKNYYQTYDKNMEFDFSLTSDFMEILLDDFGLKYAGPLKDIYTFLYTTRFPFHK